MDGQMSIWDWMAAETEKKFCFDDDINEIVSRLDHICYECGYTHDEPNFRIWEHVPNLGYRLSYTVNLIKNTDIGAFDEKCNKVVDWAKQKNIELVPMWGAAFFYNDETTARLRIFSTFKDSRKKIKTAAWRFT